MEDDTSLFPSIPKPSGHLHAVAHLSYQLGVEHGFAFGRDTETIEWLRPAIVHSLAITFSIADRLSMSLSSTYAVSLSIDAWLQSLSMNALLT